MCLEDCFPTQYSPSLRYNTLVVLCTTRRGLDHNLAEVVFRFLLCAIQGTVYSTKISFPPFFIAPLAL